MAIFFSLSQPDGLTRPRAGYKPEAGGAVAFVRIHRTQCKNVALHEDGVSFHHLRQAVEGEAVESVDQIFVQYVQVLHLLH